MCKKLIVFGGTGKTGVAVLRRAVDVGSLKVTVYARRPERIPSDVRNKLNIIEGDVLDCENVVKAMEGQDIVLSSLGKGNNLRPTTVISEGTKNIVEGMRKNQIKRLIVVSISSRLPTSTTKGPWILSNIAADHDRMLVYLNTCHDIEWYGMMSGQILDLPITNNYKIAIGKKPGPARATSSDLADFMISTITDEKKWTIYSGQLVGISSKIPFSQTIQTKQTWILLGVVASLVAVVSYGVSAVFKKL